MLGEQNGGYTNDVRNIAAELKEGIVVLDSEHLKKQFPYFGACATLEGVYAPRNAGHISPRNLIQAQQLLARRNGCDVIRDVVNRITVLGSGDFQLETENSETTITAKKVLLTTGSFTNARELLPYQLELKLELYGITVLLVGSCIRLAVVDPGFPRQGRQPQPIIWPNLYRKLLENKNRMWRPPLDPPMI